MPHPAAPLLVTHSGTFHLDDVFAYLTLRLALGLRAAGDDHTLVRTRDPAVIERAEWVWDVGTVYDPARQRFDHHQLGAPKRADGITYSAAGLVWHHHGPAAVAALLGPAASPTDAAAIAAELDATVVVRIDQIDNGEGPAGDALSLAALVEDGNPPWDAPDKGEPAAEDRAFLATAEVLEGVLRRRVEALRARRAAGALVLAAHQRGDDPRLLVLEQKLPWTEPVFAHQLPVIYAVYPVPNGNWMIDAMPPEPGSFAQRLPLPAAWAGLRDGELAAVSGVADAVFVHRQRFVGAARSRQGALALARLALAAG